MPPKCGLIHLLAAAAALVDVSGQETPSDFGIFDWIHNAPGGYFNPKQEFRYETPGDSSTLSGIFAKEDIKKGEVLTKVPWSLILKSDEDDAEGQMNCGTVKALAREMKLDAASEYGPYMQFLNSQRSGQIPSGWSEAGQEFWRRVIGGDDEEEPEIPPADATTWLEFDWYKECEGDRSDELSAKAALLVVQRADDTVLVPGYDLYNHRNGKWLNTKTKLTMGQHQVTRATRKIPAGTQIYNTYNRCENCDGRASGYGTAEILRDYGFVEGYPQTWHYMNLIQFDLDEDPEDGKLLLEWDDEDFPNEHTWERILVFLHREIRRLRQIRNLAEFYSEQLDNIPQHELEMIWQYQKANIVAMSVAIEAIEQEFGTDGKTVVEVLEEEKVCRIEGECEDDVMTINGSHYDLLGYEFDDIDYGAASCDNEDIMGSFFADHKELELLDTAYQRVFFGVDEEDDDVCLDIEKTVQICTSYRPHYHEFFVHAAARFIDTIKRVIFIGGGDSMLLHEALKYPSLELVVGLELDQAVVRKSFKYFHTQPHFDDERVEWWFGDATKSLLLLPKDYWQSFDLVLIDLSETVMSMSVTDELDVFDAMGLLLNSDGVLVKNEHYMDLLSELFDYSTQIYYESPIICSQGIIMGSNSADFLTATPKDHEIDNLLYEPLNTPENHLDYMHDYRRNNAITQGKCGDLTIPAPPTTQKKAAGIVTIVNAEKTSVPLDGATVAGKIGSAIDDAGFSSSSTPVFDNGSVYVIMKEGYIVARLFPDEQYCAFDINLWGSFHKLKSLQTSLVEAVGSTAVSAYRVVVGGMFGSSTWKEDQLLIGPQIVQTRNCEEPVVPAASTASNDIIEVALKESMKISVKKTLKAVVFCGVEGKSKCLAADLVGSFEEVKRMTKISTCPGLDQAEVSERDMYECEYNTLAKLKSLVGDEAKTRFNLVVLDARVPYRMSQVLNSILSDVNDRDSLIKQSNLFIALSTDPDGEPWRQQFLDRYRKQQLIDPVSRGYLLLRGGDTNVGFGLVSCGDDKIAYTLATYADKLQETFDKMEKKVIVDLRTIYGGEFPFMEEWEPKSFKQSDYDNEPAKTQYMHQRAVGRQNIFQLVRAEKAKDLEMSSSKLKDLLKFGLESVKLEILSHHESNDVGDGSVHIYVCKEGSAIAVWDGRNHVDINLFTYDEMEGVPEDFIDAVVKFLAHTAVAALRDDQPRGVGRVVNFASEL